jgi:mRNA interferase YafQ
MLTLGFTSQMKRDMKRLRKRSYDMDKLHKTLELLVTGEPMPPKYKDHKLNGEFSAYRECHVGGEGDWVLMYQIYKNELILLAVATGTHQDLFRNY